MSRTLPRLFALLLATVAVACAGSPSATVDRAPGPTTSTAPDAAATPDAPTASSAPAPGNTDQRCRATRLGIVVTYPAGWRTNGDGPVPTCHLFDPGQIDVEPQTEVPLDIAVTLRGSDEELTRFTEGGPASRVLSSRRARVDGHEAVAVERESSGEALLPEGTRTYQYVVDLGDRRLVASTHDLGEPSYARTRAVLDQMMEDLGIPTGDG